MKTIKSTIQLVSLPVFFVALMGTYFNMLPLIRLENEKNPALYLVDFNISMTLKTTPSSGTSFPSGISNPSQFDNLREPLDNFDNF